MDGLKTRQLFPGRGGESGVVERLRAVIDRSRDWNGKTIFWQSMVWNGMHLCQRSRGKF